MDLILTPEQRILRQSARDFLTRACPPAQVRAMEADDRGYLASLWQEMAALGWMGLALPGEYGGSGQEFLDLALLVEELGRVLLPSPFLSSVSVGAPLLLELASSAQRQRWLPGLAAGRMIAALALAEPGWRDEWGEPALFARAQGDGLVLSGTKTFVPYAPEADLLLVAARSDAGLVLAAVGRDSRGVRFGRLSTVDAGHRYEVRFENVPVPAADRLEAATVEAAIASARCRAAIASLAYATGAAERVLELTIDYANTRRQFGRPIGAFQAVAHRCAEMRSDVDAMRILTWQAAWRLSAGGGADLEVGAAKAFGNEALRRIARGAHQVFGAIGFSNECDLQLYTRRLKAAELEWGSAAAHRERVARAMGL